MDIITIIPLSSVTSIIQNTNPVGAWLRLNLVSD